MLVSFLRGFGDAELILNKHLTYQLLSCWFVPSLNCVVKLIIRLLKIRCWQVDSVLDFMFLATEPLFQHRYPRVIRVNSSYELLKTLNILIQVLSVKVVLTSANNKHVFNCFGLFVGELTRSTPRDFFEFFLDDVDFFVALLGEFEVLLQVPFFL